MTPTERKILRRCCELVLELEKTEPEIWRKWEHREWEEQVLFGPRYKPCKWFEKMSSAATVHHRRAIDKLEQSGLVETYARWGDRMTNILPTAAGWAEARKILQQAASATANKQ